mgnify:CR=1 FL=1
MILMVILVYSCSEDASVANVTNQESLITDTDRGGGNRSGDDDFSGIGNVTFSVVEERLNYIYAHGYDNYSRFETKSSEISLVQQNPTNLSSTEATTLYQMSLAEISCHFSCSTLTPKEPRYFDLEKKEVNGNTVTYIVTTGIGELSNIAWNSKSFNANTHLDAWNRGNCPNYGGTKVFNIMPQYVTYNLLPPIAINPNTYVYYSDIEVIDHWSYNQYGWHNINPNDSNPHDFIDDYLTWGFGCDLYVDPNDPEPGISCFPDWLDENDDFVLVHTPLLETTSCLDGNDLNWYRSNIQTICLNAAQSNQKDFLDFYGMFFNSTLCSPCYNYWWAAYEKIGVKNIKTTKHPIPATNCGCI